MVAAAFGQHQNQAPAGISGVYVASGMTVRAVEGMPSAYVSFCELLLQRDFEPANHQEAVEQDHHRTARVTVQKDLVLSVVMEGGRWPSCSGTWTKADGLKVTADGAHYTKKERGRYYPLEEKRRVVTYRLSLDEERRLIVWVEVASSARDKARKIGVYAFPRLSEIR